MRHYGYQQFGVTMHWVGVQGASDEIYNSFFIGRDGNRVGERVRHSTVRCDESAVVPNCLNGHVMLEEIGARICL